MCAPREVAGVKSAACRHMLDDVRAVAKVAVKSRRRILLMSNMVNW
jgi:hypothetical protein